MVEEATGSRAYVIALASVAATGGFLFGFDSGVINGTVDALQQAFRTSTAGTGFAVASVLLGCAAGAFAAGTLADRLGRKPVMLATAVLFMVSALGTGAAGSADGFNLYRLLGGLAVGAASVLAPAYIAEIAPAPLRGRLGSLQQLAIVVGLFLAFVSNYLFARAAGSAAAPFWLGLPTWRWMFWAEAVPAVAFLVGCLLIPESPRFLVGRGRLERAAQVFRHTVGGDVADLIRAVQHSLAGEAGGRLRDLLQPGTRRLRRVVWVAIGLSAFQQLVGINVIFYYGAVLWEAAGASEQVALRTNLVTGLTNILATFPAIALIDRAGRRPLLLVGSVGMTVTLAALTVAFALGQPGPEGKLQLSPAAGWLGLAAADLYIVAFGVSWGPVVWVLLGEMFGNRFRGPGLAVAAAAQWLANFIVTVSFPLLLEAAGLPGAYALYTAAAVLSLVFVYRLVPETRGKPLEAM